MSQLFCSGRPLPCSVDLRKPGSLEGCGCGGCRSGGPPPVGSLLTSQKQAGALSGENVMAVASPLVQCPAWEGGHRSKEVPF